MKNREKFNKEIKKAIDENVSGNSTMCNFIRKRVLPNLTNQKVDDTKYDYCRDWSCGICGTAFAFWLDEEYKEPPKSEVDWDKVPVDTLVRVRDGEYEKWRLRYFSGFFEYDSLKYATWNSGRTSKTAEGTDDFTTWRYCELVEEEEDGSN